MKKQILAIFSVCALVVSGMVYAGPHFGKHGMHNPLEKMIDHVDLEDDQEERVEAILERFEGKAYRKNGMKMFRGMIQLDPESNDYMQVTEQKADEAAQKLKQHIIDIAKARQEIYEILNDDQKAELKRVIDKKMQRMAKRMSDD